MTNYMRTIEARQMRDKGAIWLQGMGYFQAKPAREFRVGDVAVWNYGGTSRIVKIDDVSKHFWVIHEEYTEDMTGLVKVAQRKVKKDRLIAFSSK